MQSQLHALSCAAMNGHYDIVKMVFEMMKDRRSTQENAHFLSVGLEANDDEPRTGWTALHLACIAGHEPVVRFLVDTARMYFAQRDAQGMTPLDHARQNGHFVIAEWLDEPSADFEYVTAPSQAAKLLRSEQAKTRRLRADVEQLEEEIAKVKDKLAQSIPKAIFDFINKKNDEHIDNAWKTLQHLRQQLRDEKQKTDHEQQRKYAKKQRKEAEAERISLLKRVHDEMNRLKQENRELQFEIERWELLSD